MVKITFTTGYIIEVSACTQARPKGSVLAPCVTLVLLVVHSCVYGQRYTVPGC